MFLRCCCSGNTVVQDFPSSEVPSAVPELDKFSNLTKQYTSADEFKNLIDSVSGDDSSEEIYTKLDCILEAILVQKQYRVSLDDNNDHDSVILNFLKKAEEMAQKKDISEVIFRVVPEILFRYESKNNPERNSLIQGLINHISDAYGFEKDALSTSYKACLTDCIGMCAKASPEPGASQMYVSRALAGQSFTSIIKNDKCNEKGSKPEQASIRIDKENQKSVDIHHDRNVKEIIVKPCDSIPQAAPAVVNKTMNGIPELFVTTLDDFYKKDSQTCEFSGEYGLLKHHRAVVARFNSYEAETFQTRTGLPPDFMVKMLSLHDIGKGEGNKMAQHALTKNVIKRYASVLSLNESDCKVMCLLIAQDPIGEMLQHNDTHTMECASQELFNGYMKIIKYMPDITKKQYFEIMKTFYRCDAGSYYILEKLYLKSSGDSGVSFTDRTSEQVDKLYNKFEQQGIKKDSLNVSTDRVFRFYADEHVFYRDLDKWLQKIREKDVPPTKRKLTILNNINDLDQKTKDILKKYDIKIDTEAGEKNKYIGVFSENPFVQELHSENEIKQKNFIINLY